ncbi:MAG: hypothetical protein K2G36_07270 [Ruminococcus sp.]|nr:hypothetical protein [Ruminococcus sp.]
MDKHRQIAFILAFIVALLIMMIGKACTDSAMKKRPRPAQNVIQHSTQTPDFNNNVYNSTPVQTTTTAPVQTEPSVIYVTNMLGEVVGTEQAETVQETTTTETLSMLEEYNAGKQQHNNDIPAENNYQQPSGIHITIR